MSESWLNDLLDKNPNWERALGDRLVPTIVAMAGHDELDLTDDAVLELLAARANRSPIRPAAGEDLMAAAERRARQLGAERIGKGMWTAPWHKHKEHVLHVSWDKAGTKLLLSCGPRKRKGRPKEDFCSQDAVLATLGWEWLDLYVPEARKEAPPTFVVDLFGQVHEPPESPGVGDRTWFLSETGEERKATPRGKREPRLSPTPPATSHRLAIRLQSGEVRLHRTTKHPPVQQLEEWLAKGELQLDPTLTSGPLPPNPCSPRRAQLHCEVRDLLLREIRLYAAAGEYRAPMFSWGYVAKKLGISPALAGRVLQDLVTVVDGRSTFGRQSSPPQGVKRGAYVYSLPIQRTAETDSVVPESSSHRTGALSVWASLGTRS